MAYKWKVLVSIIFGVFMATLDTTAVNVAFPTLRAEFGATLRQAQWIVSVYVLALGVTTPAAGFLADRYGIKRVYVTGLAVFVLGSLAAGLAPTLGALVAGRVLQGVGGGLAIPNGTAMLFRGFDKKELGLALGVFGLALLFAPALGPVVAGLLIDRGHWRWIFFINVPVGVLGVLLASRLLREQRAERAPAWDAAGLALAALGFGATLWAASVVRERGWGAPEVALAFAVGAAALVALAWVELRVARDPLLDLRLFARPVFLVATLVGWVTVVAFFGAEFLLPVYLQVVRGASAVAAGSALVPLALVAGVTLPLAGALYDRVGPRPLVVAGFALLAYNTWSLAHLALDTPRPTILWLMALRGLALGLTVQTPFTAALGVVPADLVPRGTALITATRYVAQALGVATLATVLAAASGGPGAPPALAGFAQAYTVTFGLAVAATALGVLLPGWPRRWAPSGA